MELKKPCSASRPIRDIGQDIQPVDQVELLEDHRAVAAPASEGLATQAGDFVAPKRNRPLGGVDEAVDQPEHRGFAGAGASDHTDKLPGLNLERDIVDGTRFVKELRNSGEGQGSGHAIHPNELCADTGPLL